MSFNEIDHTLATVGAPREGGCCWACFDTTKAAPTNATTPMSSVEGFDSVGELSNNGYTESKAVNTTDLTGWHGSTILTTVDSESHKFKAEFTEVMRPVAAMLRYGRDNVELDGDGNLVHVSGKPAGAIVCALVFDEVMSNGWLRRTVVPRATVTSFDDVTHQKGSLMLYGMEFTAAEVGGSALEVYYAKPAAAAGGSSDEDENGGE